MLKNRRTETLHPDTLAEDLKRYIQPLRADGSQSFRLKSQKNNETGGLDRQTASEIIERNRVGLAEMQERLYGTGHWAVLLILQGLAGKDSAIKHVFTGVDPQGVDVTSFKIRRLLKCTTISYGAPGCSCPSAGGSESSIAPTMKNA